MRIGRLEIESIGMVIVLIALSHSKREQFSFGVLDFSLIIFKGKVESSLGNHLNSSTHALQSHSINWLEIREHVLVRTDSGGGTDISSNRNGIGVKSSWTWINVRIVVDEEVAVAIKGGDWKIVG